MDENKLHPNRTDPDNTKHNPNRSLPTLLDKEDNFSVFESHSILRYLAEKFFPNTHWFPNDLKARTKINNYLDWHAFTIRHSFMTIGLAFLPCFTPAGGLQREKAYLTLSADTLWGSNHPLWENRGDNGLRKQLQIVNDFWLKETKFLAGNDVSIADLTLYADCGYVLHLFGIDFKQYSKIEKWYKTMETEFGKLPARKAFIPHMEYFGLEFRPHFPTASVPYSSSPSFPSPVPNFPTANFPTGPSTIKKEKISISDHEGTESPIKGKQTDSETEKEREKFSDLHVWKEDYLENASLPDPE